MTAADGSQCAWVPGGDGSCPSGGGGGGTNYIDHSIPQWIKTAGASRLLITTRDTDDVIEDHEEIDAQTGDTLATVGHGIHRPALACGDACILGWTDVHGGTGTQYAVRTDSGWTPSMRLPRAYQVATAAWQQTLFVAWLAADEGAGTDISVQLARVDPQSGAMTSAVTVAHGASLGHLALAAGADGAVVTWQGAVDSSAQIFAQLLSLDGSLDGAPLVLPIANADDGYYSGAPAAVIDGTFHIVHGGLGTTPWFVVDPAARTIVLGSLPAFEWPRSIVAISPLAHGALLEVAGREGSIVHVEDDVVIAESGAIGDFAPSVLPLPDMLRVAYTSTGAIYTQDLTPDLAPATEPQLVLARGEDSGCNAGGGNGAGVALVLVMLGLGRMRRRS